ncbi:MAG: alginate export family protein [Planctomycetes bacterium]|nr:alginate export family protein [Planctomycetota bacterium]
MSHGRGTGRAGWWAAAVLLAAGPGAGQDDPRPPAPGPAPATSAPAEGEGPWSLARALSLPPWLHLEGVQRTRYEHLFNQFRAGAPGDDRALALRTNLLAEVRLEPVRLGAEVQDSRLYFVDDDTPVGTTDGNALELLQGYARLDLGRLLPWEGEGHLRAGRFTLDLGSRRLMARNRFRNTINAFTGVEGSWTTADGWTALGFAALPVHRRPTDRDDLVDNDVVLDRERLEVVFWGVGLSSPPLTPLGLVVEAYLLGLRERDGRDLATADRRLVTPGARARRTPRRGEVDLELEAMLQVGRSRRGAAASDRRDLDHLAWALHASAGYTFDVAGSPRLVAQLDVASGDRDPTDGRNGRFDPLFGARRFELGPTGLWGAIPRSNVITPGLRLELRPHDDVQVLAVYRPFWLAERRDAWTAARVQDPSGRSGRFVGHQLELAGRWEVVPGVVRLEAGVTALLRGRFAREAPGTNPGDPVHLHAQVEVSF